MAASMTNNNDNVYAGKPKVGGAVWAAPVGAAVPADAESALPGEFFCVGYISKDGFATSNTRKSEAKQAWGGDTVGSSQSEYSDSATLEMLETKPENLRIVYGSGNVIVDPDDPRKYRVRHNSKELDCWVWVVEQLLGTDMVMRTVIDKAQVSEMEQVKRNNEDFMSYKVTLTMYSNAEGDTYNDYYAPIAGDEPGEPEPGGGEGPEAPAPGGEGEPDGGDEPKALDDMTVDELRAYAAEHAIDISGLTLKADILTAVKAAAAGEGEEQR